MLTIKAFNKNGKKLLVMYDGKEYTKLKKLTNNNIKKIRLSV